MFRAALLFIVLTWYGCLAAQDSLADMISNNLAKGYGEVAICPKVVKGGCYRYVQGFDVTGVTTQFNLPATNVCDCIMECVNRPNLCAAWVYKFVPGNGQKSRVCTLYSNFNVPSGVTVAVNVTGSMSVLPKNIPISDFQNPQTGGVVPICNFEDGSGHDTQCYSGAIWQLQGGAIYC